MSSDFVLLSVFVILGAFVSLLLNLNEAAVKKKFKLKKFIKDNALSTITNIIVGIAIVGCTYDNPEVIEMPKLIAFILGAVSQQFFRKLCNIFVAGKPTYIGINKRVDYENDTETSDA